VAAARAAFPAWTALSPTQRKVLLRAIAIKLTEQRDACAEMLTAENGKPLSDAKGEVQACIDVAYAFAELAVHLRSGNQGAPLGELNFQHREARGVVGCIVPWNYPLATAFGNVLPALASGNTVVWKPSEKTPLSSRLVIERAFGDLPPGVVNMVLGDGTVGQALVQHPDVEVIAFIGSEAVGRKIGETCGRMLKKAILELGGKDPMIVDETVDIRRAAKFAASAAFVNAGQICTSTERIYVQHSVYDAFSAALAREAEAYVVGDGREAGTQMGPLIDLSQLEKVAAQVSEAVTKGAELHSGGVRLNRPGFFFPPTVLGKVPGDARMMRDETFGPVAPLFPFDDFDEAIALANESSFGLAAIVLTESAPRAIKALQSLKVGTVKINTMRGRAPGAASEPVKGSGFGHGSGMEILLELTRQKAVHWRGSL
jgi:acyl-CoA reductase-like NAD-dependent aldehyde dehydrogenase